MQGLLNGLKKKAEFNAALSDANLKKNKRTAARYEGKQIAYLDVIKTIEQYW